MQVSQHAGKHLMQPNNTYSVGQHNSRYSQQTGPKISQQYAIANSSSSNAKHTGPRTLVTQQTFDMNGPKSKSDATGFGPSCPPAVNYLGTSQSKSSRGSFNSSTNANCRGTSLAGQESSSRPGHCNVATAGVAVFITTIVCMRLLLTVFTHPAALQVGALLISHNYCSGTTVVAS